jgi:hypothetical protein
VNTFKTARLNLEQLGDRCMPSSLNFTKITMAEVTIAPRDTHTSATEEIRKAGGVVTTGLATADEIRVQRVEMD